jgi:hypothetical protein
LDGERKVVLAADHDAAISALQSRLDAEQAGAAKLATKCVTLINEAAYLRQQLAERDAVLREFCERVERGEVRSKSTYAKFKALLSSAEPVKNPLQAEIDRLNQIINTPQADDFLRAVSTEAEHQRQRLGSEHDDGKTPADWFWLVGYLAGKALHAHASDNVEKAEHHVITTAAALANWHRAMFGKTNMRPGIAEPAKGGDGEVGHD